MMRPLIAITLAVAACGATHQQFASLDPAKMSPSDRVQTFMRLRPVSQTMTTENGTNPIDSSIILDDKTEVFLPEDLAPLVGADSETMRAARESIAAREKSGIAWWVSLGLVIGGAALVVTSEEEVIGIPTSVGYATVLSSLIGGVFVRHYNREDIGARRRAFAAYPRDLGAKLNVCAHGLQVVACEAPIAAPPVPAAAPPQLP